MYRKPEKALGQSRRNVLSVDSEKKTGDIHRGSQRCTPGYTGLRSSNWVIYYGQNHSVTLRIEKIPNGQKLIKNNPQGGGGPGIL